MRSPKKSLVIVIAVIAGLILLFFLLSIYAEKKLKTELEGVLGPQSYEELDVSLFQRRIVLKDLRYRGPGKSVDAEKIILEGINFYKYFIRNEFSVHELRVVSPTVSIWENDTTSGTKKKDEPKKISIANVKVTGGLFQKRNSDSAENNLYMRLPLVSLEEVKVDSASRLNKIPFDYSNLYVRSDSLWLQMNPEHNMTAGFIEFGDGKTMLRNFRIRPEYSKQGFDKRIPYEKDRISLEVDSVHLDNLKFSFEQDTLFLRNPLMTVSGANLHIYRNKLLPDDRRRKPLYSELLRNAPVNLNFEKLKVKESRIEYEENVQEEWQPSRVFFEQINATVTNLLNFSPGDKDLPRTNVTANAQFMGSTPVELEWSFKVSDETEKFLISGSFGSISGETLNPLLKPAMNIEVRGTIHEVYFTFTGNDDFATGDVRVDYEKFKIKLLEEEDGEVKKVLSAIANLFVDNDGHSGEIVENDVRVKRNKNRSFWNFVWTALREGIKQTFSQF